MTTSIKSIPRLVSWIILLPLLLTACQGVTVFPIPSPTVPSSPTASRTRQPRPTQTSVPDAIPTITRLPHLQIGPQELSGVKVQFWYMLSGLPGQEMARMVDEFNQSNEWGIQIVAQDLESRAALFQRMVDSFTVGGTPQVVLAPGEDILAWNERLGEVINLEDYLQDGQWGMSESQAATFARVFWEQGWLKDRRLSLPALRTAGVLLYNQSWAKELGFDQPPMTPQEFQSQACAAGKSLLEDKDPYNNGLGGWITDHQALEVLGWLAGFGMRDFVDSSGRFTFSTPAGQEAFTYLRTLFDQGCAWNSRDPQPYEYFAGRQALIYSGTLEDLLIQQRTMERWKSPDQWLVLPYPSQNRQPIIFTSGQDYALLAASPEQQLAGWLWIRWLVQPEQLARLVRVTGSWPVSTTAADLLVDYQAEHTQWAETLNWIPESIAVPKQGSWGVVQNVLEDAAWQVFQANIKVEQVPDILHQLDATIPDVVKHAP